METIYGYLTETEARGEQAYRSAYYAEYMRLYEVRHSEDRQRLLFWAALAHHAANSARERVLEADKAETSQASNAELVQ